MPAVSVIMPAYNVEPYIEESLRSALAQTLTDLEVLVVDDGSRDRTADAVRPLAEADTRIRLIRQENRGLAGARNTALRAARSPLFALLDSDDVWMPDFLEKQVAILKAHPDVDIVTGNGRVLGGRDDGQLARPYPDERPVPDLATIIGDERSVFIMSVFRRRVYDTIGPFDESMRTNEDYDFWLRAAIAGFRFARNDTPLGLYRVRADSLSANDLQMVRGILKVYEKLGPRIADRPREVAILDRQMERFQTEWLAAEARAALESSDYAAAREHLVALHARRGGPTLAIARLLVRWAPGLLARVYGLRRTRVTPVTSVELQP